MWLKYKKSIGVLEIPSGVTMIINAFIAGCAWLVLALAPSAANADLATLQDKYAGVVINGTTLSKKQIEAIYLGSAIIIHSKRV